MTTLYLVGCGKAKLDRPAPARELYTGSLFRAARAYVEALGAPWQVLSARYGLVRPDAVVTPYEQKLWRRKDDLSAWALTAASGIIYTSGGYKVRPVFLCGADYADPIVAFLERWDVPTEQPLRGLELGARLAWFKARSGANSTPSADLGGVRSDEVRA